MILSNLRVVLRVVRPSYELEPVEPQDEHDTGYLWAKREEVREFDLSGYTRTIQLGPNTNKGRPDA